MSNEKDLDDLLDDTFGIKKPKVVETAVKRLSPPPVVIIAPKIVEEEMDLNFNKIANSSDFQRFIIYLAKQISPELFKGVSTRVSAPKMKQQFNQKRAEYKLVMTELKQKLEERRAKIDGLL